MSGSHCVYSQRAFGRRTEMSSSCFRSQSNQIAFIQLQSHPNIPPPRHTASFYLSTRASLHESMKKNWKNPPKKEFKKKPSPDPLSPRRRYILFTYCIQKGWAHWLINYKDTKAKCRHFKNNWPIGNLRQLFTRVYRLEIKSVMLVFSTQLCILFPL
jgi:hypothetical protein